MFCKLGSSSGATNFSQGRKLRHGFIVKFSAKTSKAFAHKNLLKSIHSDINMSLYRKNYSSFEAQNFTTCSTPNY